MRKETIGMFVAAIILFLAGVAVPIFPAEIRQAVPGLMPRFTSDIFLSLVSSVCIGLALTLFAIGFLVSYLKKNIQEQNDLVQEQLSKVDSYNDLLAIERNRITEMTTRCEELETKLKASDAKNEDIDNKMNGLEENFDYWKIYFSNTLTEQSETLGKEVGDMRAGFAGQEKLIEEKVAGLADHKSELEKKMEAVNEQVGFFNRSAIPATRVIISYFNELSDYEIISFAKAMFDSGVVLDELREIGLSNRFVELVSATYHARNLGEYESLLPELATEEAAFIPE